MKKSAPPSTSAEPSDDKQARASRACRLVIDPPEIIEAERALQRGQFEYERALAEATPTQRRRAKEFLSGKSVRAIDKNEGRAPSTVSESLTAPSVRAVIAAQLRLMTANGEPVFLAALKKLTLIALDAQRPGPFGMVPHNRTRLDAIVRLLHYYDPSNGGASAPATQPTKSASMPSSDAAAEPSATHLPGHAVEQSIIERSVTARECRIVTRTQPERTAKSGVPKP